ncbi:MAG: DUF1553 domain-containing protein [Gemmataceae bacterium]
MRFDRWCFASLLFVWLGVGPSTAAECVQVEILEGMPDKLRWDLSQTKVTGKYTEPAFALLHVPTKYSPKAHAIDRSNPYVLRATATIQLPAGKYRMIVRSRHGCRFYIDGKKKVEHTFMRRSQNGHEKFRKEPGPVAKDIKPLAHAQRDTLIELHLDGKSHRFQLEVVVGGQKLRPEVGRPAVAIARDDGPFFFLSPLLDTPFTIAGWGDYAEASWARNRDRNAKTRLRVSTTERQYWARRHELARRLARQQEAPQLPKVNDNTPVQNFIDQFLCAKLEAAKVEPTPLTNDAEFLRRVALDTVGVIPSVQEINDFQADEQPDRRQRVIKRLLADQRWADHWVSYWQDVLSENPGLLTPSLNNTGPFRWWLYEALSDNIPVDRFTTDLVMMEGSAARGAPAAFGLATNNDSPMAAKAHVLGRAFLGVDLTCARCHDAPFRPYKQKQLFAFGAMLNRKSLTVPKTSSVDFKKGTRRPEVDVTLKPGSKVQPEWLFPKFLEKPLSEFEKQVLRNPKDQRERLAVTITSPQNTRFAKVIVNRLWQRYMGVGLVQDPDDWYDATISHPKLLDYLALELIKNNYDFKHIAELIFNSHAYQRRPVAKSKIMSTGLFEGPARRKMTAEQLVDSLYVAMGKQFDSEEITFDPAARQQIRQCKNLGYPRRAWQFATLANERDRPALARPFAQGYVDLLTAFGWRDSRPTAQTLRNDMITPVQAMTLANGQLMNRLVRLTDDSTMTDTALRQQKLEEYIRLVYQRILSRQPDSKEMKIAKDLLEKGYKTRLTGKPALPPQERPWGVTWANHLRPEATNIAFRAEEAARKGPAPTPRLQTDWRERAEDVVWSLLNSPEFFYVP